jgi:hypothetical protein
MKTIDYKAVERGGKSGPWKNRAGTRRCKHATSYAYGWPNVCACGALRPFNVRWCWRCFVKGGKADAN